MNLLLPLDIFFFAPCLCLVFTMWTLSLAWSSVLRFPIPGSHLRPKLAKSLLAWQLNFIFNFLRPRCDGPASSVRRSYQAKCGHNLSNSKETKSGKKYSRRQKKHKEKININGDEEGANTSFAVSCGASRWWALNKLFRAPHPSFRFR